MIFDGIEWDEHNLDHATKRRTAEEIEQAIFNAPRMRTNRRSPGRSRIESVTVGCKAGVTIVALVPNGVRPITGWEA